MGANLKVVPGREIDPKTTVRACRPRARGAQVPSAATVLVIRMNAAPMILQPAATPSVTVGDLMSRRLVTIDPDAPLSHARDLFERHRFHHILVTEGARLVGIMSDRDLLKGLSPFLQTMAERTIDVDTLRRKVHTVMQRKVITTPPTATLDHASARIVKHGISSLPVVDPQGALLGILTWKDILRWLVHAAQGPAGLSLAPGPR